MDKKKTALTAGIVAGVITVTGFISSIRFLKEGEIGIQTKAGAYVNTIEDAGIHLVSPFFIGDLKKMDIRDKEKTFDLESVSSDAQDVYTKVSIYYNLDKNKAEEVFKNIGTNYEEIYINNSAYLEQAIKMETAKYSADQIFVHREEIANSAKDKLNEELNEKGIIINAVKVPNISFSEQYNQAIEEKQVAEQKKQTAEKNKEIAIIEAEKQKETAIIEADTKVITAEKEAAANEKLNNSISDKIIELQKIKAELEAIQKWDGKLPSVTGDNIPFINIDSEKTLTK